MEIKELYNNAIKIKSADIRAKELDNIELRFKNILKKENLNHLNISVCIDTMKTKVKDFNAHAKILKEDSYEIVFCPKLLTLIDGLSIELTSKYKECFSEIDKNKFYNKNNRNKLQLYIYEYFSNHIFYHELFHVIKGHLKYLNNNMSLNIISEFEDDNKKNVDNLYLEIDADKYASINSVLGGFEILENIRKLGFNFNEIFYIIFTSINELFYVVHLLQKKPTTRKGHPILFDRTILFNHYFMKTLNQDEIKNIFEASNINYNEINRLNELNIAVLTKKYKLEDSFNSSDVIKISEEYYNFRKNIQLDSYSYDIKR
jgi:hypothetical protein